MRALVRLLLTALLVVVIFGVIAIVYVKSTGLRGQPEPGALEARIAHAISDFAIPSAARARTNPLEPSKEAISRSPWPCTTLPADEVSGVEPQHSTKPVAAACGWSSCSPRPGDTNQSTAAR